MNLGTSFPKNKMSMLIMAFCPEGNPVFEPGKTQTLIESNWFHIRKHP